MSLDKNKRLMRLYAVTDRSWSKEGSSKGKLYLLEQIEEALSGGITLLQLREKGLSYQEFLQEAIDAKKLCKKYNVPLIINDNVDIALECIADGIHVGQSDMDAKNVRSLIGDKMLLGVSAQSVSQALAAEKNGADYIGVGALFSTSTKLDAGTISFETLKEICLAVSIPVCAIGGISKENMCLLKGSGIDGVALVSAIFAAADIKNECKKLLKASDELFG